MVLTIDLTGSSRGSETQNLRGKYDSWSNLPFSHCAYDHAKLSWQVWLEHKTLPLQEPRAWQSLQREPRARPSKGGVGQAQSVCMWWKYLIRKWGRHFGFQNLGNENILGKYSGEFFAARSGLVVSFLLGIIDTHCTYVSILEIRLYITITFLFFIRYCF